jgi:hypothetical protein
MAVIIFLSAWRGLPGFFFGFGGGNKGSVFFHSLSGI